jgi:membrane-associated phospholipid phosphatase/protein-S-isoprenylcysteine O-methyltransferase Ste14
VELLKRVLYGALFTVAVPLALIGWAHGARDAVHVAPLHSPFYGVLLAGCGVMVMALGMLSLWRFGGGLPMNAFPPPRFVARGIYTLVPHPIYVGFVLACAGVAIAVGSASGLWLVTPCVALACAALVLGYELPDLRHRFGPSHSSAWLPLDSPDAPALLERVRVYFVVLLPWLVLFEAISVLCTGSSERVNTALPFEQHLPVLPWTELLYFSAYVVVILAPLLLRTGHGLRRFAQRGLIAMALLFPLYLWLPVFVPPRPFQSASLIGELLRWERTPYSGAAAFPSFHVAWALIAAAALAEDRPRSKWLWSVWALLVAVSCVTTGMHSVVDVVAGAVAFVCVARMPSIWHAILRAAERIADSWHEWRFGPLRIINHGGYAALGVLIGMSLIDTLLGPGRELLTVSVFLCSTIGAALWAQWVEGSPTLLRPMGFYGGLIGAILGTLPALWLDVNLWVVLAAAAIGAPWIQGIGRLRCLVQGCCHGRRAEDLPGISYTHPRSRVCRLANLGGVPVHATPVYSILWNVVIAASLLRLLQLHAACTLIFGVYLLLCGVGRFAEEAYRGEPQTLSILGLHIYQWTAIATVAAGAAITTVSSSPMPPIAPPRVTSLLLALGCGAVSWFVTGMDFPESSRRFARLT